MSHVTFRPELDWSVRPTNKNAQEAIAKRYNASSEDQASSSGPRNDQNFIEPDSGSGLLLQSSKDPDFVLAKKVKSRGSNGSSNASAPIQMSGLRFSHQKEEEQQMTARELDSKDKYQADRRIEFLDSAEGSANSFGMRHSPTFKMSEPPSSERAHLVLEKTVHTSNEQKQSSLKKA